MMDWLTLVFLQVVLAVFAISGSSFLFPDKFRFPRLRDPPPIPNPENLRKDLASQTFRLKGIPATYKGRETTKEDVKELVRKDFAVEEFIEIYVESLGRNPTSRSQKIATLSFSKTPRRLATSPKSARAFQGVSISDLRLDIDFHGLTPLHSHDDPECDLEIVALSGLNGHAFGSFKQRGGQFMWLRDDLARSLPGARIYIYGYESEMQGSDSFQTLTDLGLTFQVVLEALLEPEDENRAPNPLVLVGHSLGGLVLKQALCEMANSKGVPGKAILKSLQAVLFFGTPNQGMDITSLVPMVEGQPNEPFLRSLDYDSSELRQQAKLWDQTFVLREGDILSASFLIVSFYETRESPTAIQVDGKWKMAGPSKKLVDRPSATHGRPWNGEEQLVRAINRNHSDMVKFEASTDPIYQAQVLPLFTRFYGTAKKRSPMLFLSRARQDELFACRSSLSFQEEQVRSGQIVVAENETCTWFPQHPSFQEWMRDGRGLLWLQGLPGAGKSTIMKHAVEWTQRQSTKKPAVAAFFIYGLGMDLQKTLLGLYCSLIRQLIPQIPFAFLPMLSHMPEEPGPRAWGLLDLQAHLKQALREASKTRQTVLFIDALDEFSKAEIDTLLALLGDLCYDEESAGLKVNICVSCRYHPNLFTQGVIIRAEENNGQDIATFVRQELRDLPFKKKVPLGEFIIPRSNGLFQWAGVVCQNVRDHHRSGKPLEKILRLIEDIPQDLHALYERLFKEMSGREMEQSLKLFRWVGFSERMISLRELQHAWVLAPDMKGRSIEEYSTGEDFLHDLDDLINSVKYYSKGLIGFEAAHKLDGDQAWGERVRLIHASVMDYLCERGLEFLEGEIGISSTGHPEGTAHYYISRCCLRYMFMRGTREDFDTRQESSSRFPLDHYVQSAILYHFNKAEEYGVEQFELLEIFGWPNETAAMASFRAFVPRVNQASLIHVLAACGVMSAIRPLIQYSGEKDGSKYESEIYSLLSHGEVREDVLLPSGRINLDIRNSIAMTPLHFALFFDQVDVAHELLNSNRVDVNAVKSQGERPLHNAANKGHSSIVRELLRNTTVNPNAQDDKGRTALHSAVMGCKEEVIAILLEDCRVNVNARNKDGETPLHTAIDSGELSLVEPLLASANIDVNVKEKKGQSPLIFFMVAYPGLADESEHGELANVLLALLRHPKIDTHAKDKMQRTALFHAAASGLAIYVRVLVDHGVRGAGEKDKLGRTPLSQAAVKGHLEIVRRLLAVEELEENILQYAYQESKKKGKVDIMRCLVETGKITET